MNFFHYLCAIKFTSLDRRFGENAQRLNQKGKKK